VWGPGYMVKREWFKKKKKTKALIFDASMSEKLLIYFTALFVAFSEGQFNIRCTAPTVEMMLHQVR
jgi:hypothetical protein